jgi:hypothetical protein
MRFAYPLPAFCSFICCICMYRHLWRAYRRLDGTTPTGLRQLLVDQFNKDVDAAGSHMDIPLFLISTRAGGMGLNLTSATKVIIFDCSWNPTSDMQAQDRCYRYGQTKQVTVYRLVAQGTVEELIYMRQLYKQALQSSAVQSRPEVPTAPAPAPAPAPAGEGEGEGEGEDGGGGEGGLTLRGSQEDSEAEADRAADYTARKKHSGEGRRAFYGVQGHSHGELFGLENLLQFEVCIL